MTCKQQQTRPPTLEVICDICGTKTKIFVTPPVHPNLVETYYSFLPKTNWKLASQFSQEPDNMDLCPDCYKLKEITNDA